VGGQKKHAVAAHCYLLTIHYTEHFGEEKRLYKVLQSNNFPHELENASAQKIMAPLVTQKFNKLLHVSNYSKPNLKFLY
jgi:hypothetical protein